MLRDFTGGPQGSQPDISKVTHTPDNIPVDLLALLGQMKAVGDNQHDDRQLTLTEEFEQFHQDNPAVYLALRHVARRWRNRKGNQTIGFPCIWETTRYEVALATTGDPYKLDNNLRAFYSRLLMIQEDDLAGMFEIRRAREADEWAARKAAELGKTFPARTGQNA